MTRTRHARSARWRGHIGYRSSTTSWARPGGWSCWLPISRRQFHRAPPRQLRRRLAGPRAGDRSDRALARRLRRQLRREAVRFWPMRFVERDRPSSSSARTAPGCTPRLNCRRSACSDSLPRMSVSSSAGTPCACSTAGGGSRQSPRRGISLAVRGSCNRSGARVPDRDCARSSCRAPWKSWSGPAICAVAPPT